MPADLTVRTYDPKKIIVTFGGTPLIGYAEDQFILVEPNGDAFTKTKGADGSVQRTNLNQFDYTVTITLLKTSLSNDFLSALHEADKITNTGVLPLLIKDLQGIELLFAPQAWIMATPAKGYSNALETRVWKIDTGIATNTSGGNTIP